jgi:uracil-DNA glycosylase
VKRKTWNDLNFWDSSIWRDIQNDLRDIEADVQAKIVPNGYYPEKKNIFKALQLTPLPRVKAVIVGQDPYHNGDATGLAFSCNRPPSGLRPSLKNIFTEYQSDLGFPEPKSGNLSAWAARGVLLLNSILTVTPGAPLSHHNWGWQTLTGEVLRSVAQERPEAVFILWGNEARSTFKDATSGIPEATLNVVSSVHPSPRSADKGFFGSKPFTKTNALLGINKVPPINWRLPS